MPKRSEFVEWLVEQLSALGAVRPKAMFGGYGLYLDQTFFAIIADDVLYLKADETNKPQFIDAGCEPFRYAGKDGKVTQLSYYQPPDSALDDRMELMDWVRGAVAAGLRANLKPKKRPTLNR